MAWRTRVTIGALATAASTGHVLYPAWLGWVSRGRTATTPPEPEQWPAVTVLVPAYLEVGCIEDKVRDVLANGYPGSLDVMVVADGDRETAARAERAGATVVSADERLGKAQALNLGMSKVTTPVVVLTDANNTLSPGALAALVRHLEDPTVGAVAGEKVESDGRGEDLYWRFESWLKQREWRMGTTIGLVGELSAIRTDAWAPIPEDISIDDLWIALDFSARGYRIAYEPEAKAFEPPEHRLSRQWERRTRIAASALYAFTRRRDQLRLSGGLMAAEIWGHRLARYTVVPIAHVILLARALRGWRASWLAKLFLVGHVIGALTLVRNATRAPAARGGEPGAQQASPESVPGPSSSVPEKVAQAAGQALFLDAVAIGGLVRFARGERLTRWTSHRR